jgi:uncharacterized phage protein (TIGR01671 family)
MNALEPVKIKYRPVFRAYDVFTKKMWKWEDHNAFTTGKGSIKDWFTDQDLRPMQWIGLQDENGELIFEGDTVEVISDKDGRVVDTVDVEYVPELCSWSLSSWLFNNMLHSPDAKIGTSVSFNVIGNIYEGIK